MKYYLLSIILFVFCIEFSVAQKVIQDEYHKDLQEMQNDTLELDNGTIIRVGTIQSKPDTTNGIAATQYKISSNGVKVYRLKKESEKAFKFIETGFSSKNLPEEYWELCNFSILATPGDIFVIEIQGVQQVMGLSITGLEYSTFADFDMGGRYADGDRKGKCLTMPKKIDPGFSDFSEGVSTITFNNLNNSEKLGEVVITVQ